MQKKTVTPNQQTSQNLNGVQTASLVTSHYEGVVPPPEMLEQFNRVNPTYADKIMQMALEASKRQNDMVENQRRQIDGDVMLRQKEIEENSRLKRMMISGENSDKMFKNILSLIGIVCTAVMCIFLLYVAKQRLNAGETFQATVIGIIPVLVVGIGAFRNGRK